MVATAQHRWLWVLLLAVLAYFGLGFAVEAMAQGVFSANSGFTCRNGAPVGYLLNVCPEKPSLEDGQVFSFFICQFEAILNEVLGKVYCSVVWEATPAVKAALTLLIALTGVSFLIGLTPFTAKELAVLGIKFSLVLAFATQAEYMIGYGYALFVALAKEGIVVVLDYLFTSGVVGDRPGGFSGGNDVYRVFDEALSDLMSAATENESAEGDNRCQNSIFAMLVILAVAVPPMAFIGMYFLFRLLWMVLRAVFGYCQGLLGITFLTVLAPIYVSFALFKPTRSLFDKWVKYLISFGFQMVIVFAFIGMLFYILDQVSDDFGDYMELVQPYEQTVEQTRGVFNPVAGCGICELAPMNNNEPPACKEGGKVLPVTEMSKNKEFLEFITIKAIALIILFYVLDIMIGFVPEMARHLAGPKYAGQLGGGGSHLQFPGERAIGGAFAAGGKGFMESSNSAQGLVVGMVAAGRHAMARDGGIVDTAIRSIANPLEPHRNLDAGPDPADNSPAGNLFGAAAAVTGAAALAKHYGMDSGVPRSSSSSSDSTQSPTGNDTIEGSDNGDMLGATTGDDTMNGGQSRDMLLDQALDDAAKEEAKVNVGVMADLRQSLMALENPNSQNIGEVLARMPVSREELLVTIRAMDKNELDPEVIEYLNSMSM